MAMRNTMFDPPHPGAFIQEVYLEPNGMSGCDLALKLGYRLHAEPRFERSQRRQP